MTPRKVMKPTKSQRKMTLEASISRKGEDWEGGQNGQHPDMAISLQSAIQPPALRVCPSVSQGMS